MEETLKWGMPIYTFNNKNVACFGAFKSYVSIWIYQVVFLEYLKKKIINAQEGVTKALRQWRFSSVEEIQDNRETILIYLEESIENQKSGKELKPERNKPLELPQQLEHAFRENPALQDRFEALSLSNKRDFAEHVESAMREETRKQRLEKVIPMILEGIGINDKYNK